MDNKEIGHLYELGQAAVEYSHRFHTNAITYTFRFLPSIQIVADLHYVIIDLFDHVIKTIVARAGAKPSDLIGIYIEHPALNKPIIYAFEPRRQFSGAKLVSLIERVMQSHEELNFDDEMRIKVVTIHLPVGGSKHRRKRISVFFKEWYNSHCGSGGAFIEIKNNDYLCLARAIAVGIAYHNKTDTNYKWSTIIRGDKNRNACQKIKAKQIMTHAGMENYNGQCGIPELIKIQNSISEYQIKLYDNLKMLIYSGPPASKTIHIMNHNDHYTFIKSMPVFLGKKYYCHDCEKGYDFSHKHRCKATCLSCYGKGKCLNDNTSSWCQQCNRYFMNAECFRRHTEIRGGGHSTCQKIKRCLSCGKLISGVNNHQCGYKMCRSCREYVLWENHKCYITQYTSPDKCGKFKYIFFDFEATQENQIKVNDTGAIMLHNINLAVAQTVCEQCCNNINIGECTNCEGQKIFYNRDSFCDWLFSNTNRNAVAIAHFMKGYDGQFVLQYLHEQGIVPKIITKGSELMSIEVEQINLKIIDSINFFNMPLSALPKTFNISELHKGYFPHMFNKTENLNYIGPYPDAFFYGPANMKPEQRQKFYDWYNAETSVNKQTQTMRLFNFKIELEKYCISDVDILRRASMIFRTNFLSQHGIDPFATSITIASACNKVYRLKYLKPKTIGIVPHLGYRRKDVHSITAIKWLKYISYRDNIRILHAENGGEVRVSRYKVDGMCGNTIYEFYGCRWHGCPKCMPRRQQLCADFCTTAEEAYEKTLDRKKFLQQLGYTLVEKWQCEYNFEIKNNADMKNYINNLEIVDPINPREALYGGRVNATKLFHTCQADEKIFYYDIVSLYPFVNKYAKYPLGHPTIITENFQDISKYEGIAKCTLIPPRKLYHPVLPYRVDKKLLFPLCRLCAEKKQRECNHSDTERAVTGTWVIAEILKAIEMGYKVLKIFEVWHYENTTIYDPINNPDGGLFAGYVNANLKIKQESDGWPSWAEQEPDKELYIQQYFAKEGIQLEKNKITKNPGHRALSKIMLNSLWGKFGQRNNQTKVEYFSEYEKYCRLLTDPTKEIKGINFVNDSLVAVSYAHVDEHSEIMSNTNVIIAAYTTAFARLKLYTILEKLGERVLYFDTDSVIFLSKPDEWEPPTGPYLGDLSDELKNYPPGTYIKSYVSGGPKNYALQICNQYGKCIDKICKVRGFTLSNVNQKRINFKTMCQKVKQYVCDKISDEINIIYPKIVRENRSVLTKNVQRKYRINYDKRVLLNNYYTLPYGY